MNMLEKMLDLKNTFEGKFLAVFMSVVLVMSMTNILAFAGDEGELPAVEGESTEQPEKAAEPVAEASDEKVVDEAVQHGEGAAAADADASKTTPSEPLVSTAVDEAVVTFETDNAFVSIKDQLLSGTTLTTELHKELRFTASADTGFELGTITAKNAANVDVPVTTQDGVSTIAADYVDSTLVVTVAATPVATDEPEVETKPITSDTKIEGGEVDADQGDQPEAEQPEAPVVEVEADVSSPAFEGYAQAGDVLVKVTAAEGILPEGTTVQAVQVTSSTVMDAVENAVERQGKELETAVAIDVTLVGPEGNVIQPSASVNVCFFNAGIAGETMGVYHVSNDGSSVSPVSARQADAAAQSFDVSHFSIYVVTVEGTPQLATYNFYGVDGTTLLDRQIVKTGDTLYEPKTPAVDEGQSFQGWYAKNGSEWAGKFSAFGKQTVVGTATYDLYAKSSKAYYVYFMDNSGSRVFTTKSGTSGDVITTDVTFPLAPNESVTGWYTDADRTNKVDSVELKDSSVTLYPKVETGKWITFDAKGGSYATPQFVGVGDVSSEPAEPTRSGYSFAGWYGNESCEGDSYSFGSGLTEDTTLYAKWEAAKANYSVVVWLEAADSTHEEEQYDYVTTLDYQGTTDEAVALPSASEIKSSVGTFAIDNKHIMDAVDESSDKTITVKGDGTAIANVYLNRVEYTIDLQCTKGSSSNKKDYTTASTITANYGADISAQWAEATKKINNAYGVRVWVANPSGPGTTSNPVIAPFQTMTENRTLYYVKNGSALHHLELYVEQVGNTKEIGKTSATDKRYNSGYRYSNNYNTSMFEIEDTLVFNGTGVHATIANYVNALSGYEWVGADLADNQGFFNQGGTWTARHYFQRKAYTITFNNEGSVRTSEAIKYGWSIEDEGEEPSAKDAGVPEGSTFAGWYTSPTFAEGTEFDFADATMPARNLALYAKWVLPTYQVTYYADMDGSSVATQHEVAYGKTTSSESSSIVDVPEGYKWVGWMTRSGSDGDYTYLPFNFDTQAYGDIELYPYYINNESYSVSYDANGGAGDVPTDGLEYAQGSFAEVAKSTLTAPSENQTFLGWSTHVDGSGTRHYPGGMVQLGNADITLYAQWGQPAPQTSLTYDANGGTGDSATIDLANNEETVLRTAKDLGF